MNILFSLNKSSQQTAAYFVCEHYSKFKPPETSNAWQQNMSYLHLIRTCFFIMCTHLDATDAGVHFSF